MKIAKTLDIISKSNVIELNAKKILKDILTPSDLRTVVKKINDKPTQLKNKQLQILFNKFYTKFESNVMNDVYSLENIHFVNLIEYPLPAYYNNVEKNFVCNFLKPVQYLSANDLIANLLYTFIYRMQLYITDNLNRKMCLSVIADFYFSVILMLVGKSENLFNDYDNILILKLILLKYVDDTILNSSNKLSLKDYFIYLPKTIKNSSNVSRQQLDDYDEHIQLNSFRHVLATLKHLDILQNVDVKSFVNLVYKRYGILPLTTFETPDRIFPFFSILGFSNILSNNFVYLINDKILDAGLEYIYHQYSTFSV